MLCRHEAVFIGKVLYLLLGQLFSRSAVKRVVGTGIERRRAVHELIELAAHIGLLQSSEELLLCAVLTRDLLYVALEQGLQGLLVFLCKFHALLPGVHIERVVLDAVALGSVYEHFAYGHFAVIDIWSAEVGHRAHVVHVVGVAVIEPIEELAPVGVLTVHGEHRGVQLVFCPCGVPVELQGRGVSGARVLGGRAHA